MRNKLLASILTVCMLLTMLPAAAFAAETEAESGTEQTATATEQSDPSNAYCINRRCVPNWWMARISYVSVS